MMKFILKAIKGFWRWFIAVFMPWRQVISSPVRKARLFEPDNLDAELYTRDRSAFWLYPDRWVEGTKETQFDDGSW